MTAGFLCAQAKTDIPRMPDGKPSFQGYWNIPYTPNMAQAKGEASVPYTDAGRKAFIEHDAKDDPTSLCTYPGVPRIMQSPYPMQILQTPEYVIFIYEYMRLWRVIPTDGRPHRDDVAFLVGGHPAASAASLPGRRSISAGGSTTNRPAARSTVGTAARVKGTSRLAPSSARISRMAPPP